MAILQRAELLTHAHYSWICIRTETLAGVFTASLAAYLVYGRDGSPTAANTGFSLTMAVGLGALILIYVRVYNGLEISGTPGLRAPSEVSYLRGTFLGNKWGFFWTPDCAAYLRVSIAV